MSTKAGVSLDEYLSTHYEPECEFSLRQGSDVRLPDLSVYRRGARLYRGVLDEPPILCIEIGSPSQNPRELFEKCDA